MVKFIHSIGIVCMVSAVAVCCSSKAKAEDSIPKFNPNPSIQATSESVTGVVAVNDNGGGNVQVLIEVKPDSKSVVSYEVTGAQKEAVAAQKGKTVTATGMVRNLSPFHKLIEVSEIK